MFPLSTRLNTIGPMGHIGILKYSRDSKIREGRGYHSQHDMAKHVWWDFKFGLYLDKNNKG